MLDVRLQSFMTVAKTRNYTKAARLLKLTQPAVSQHIKYLENYYQITLFYKKNKQMELTEEGKILLDYAEAVSRLSTIVKNRLANKTGIIKKYNLGATLTIGGYILPEIIGRYKQEHENIDIILQVENTETIIKKLYSGEIDLGVIEGLFDRSKVHSTKLKDDELVLAVSQDHPFAEKDAVNIEQVLADRLILREKGSGTRMVFEDYLQRSGYKLDERNIYMEVGDIKAIVSLVESNLGCTVISKEVLTEPLRRQTIKIVPINNFRMIREFNFIYLMDSDTQFRNDFINFCRRAAPSQINKFNL